MEDSVGGECDQPQYQEHAFDSQATREAISHIDNGGDWQLPKEDIGVLFAERSKEVLPTAEWYRDKKNAETAGWNPARRLAEERQRPRMRLC